jgi:Domain of unknown function (DUF4047)
MAFYAGTQLVGETEAAFSSQASPESITMEAAFVFPGTIHKLEDRAQKVAESMTENVKTILPPSPGASRGKLKRQLDEVTAMEEELSSQMGILQELYEEVSAYHRKIQKQTEIHTYDYVREGFKHVEGLLKGVQATVDFSQIEEIRSSILIQIQKLEDQEQPPIEEIQTDPVSEEPSIDQPQTDPDSDNPDSQHEASSEITNEVETGITEEASKDIPNDKQVTVHEEETVEDRE